MLDDAVEGLVTLQERAVNLIKQLNMPLVEVSIVTVSYTHLTLPTNREV